MKTTPRFRFSREAQTEAICFMILVGAALSCVLALRFFVLR